MCSSGVRVEVRMKRMDCLEAVKYMICTGHGQVKGFCLLPGGSSFFQEGSELKLQRRFDQGFAACSWFRGEETVQA